MGRLSSNVWVACASIREQRHRALLSAMGIMVASMAIVLLISIAKGVQADVSREVDELGANLLIVLPRRIEEEAPFNPGLLGISYLQEADIARIRQVPGVLGATPLTFVGAGARAGSNSSASILVIGTGPEWFRLRSLSLSEGRPFGFGDEAEPVCVLGSLAKESLFGEAQAAGKTIVHNGTEYRVLGVTQRKGAGVSFLAQEGFENAVILPYRYVKTTQPNAQIDRILIQTAPDREPKSLVADVERVLGSRLQREAYSVLTQQDLLKVIFKVMSILTWLLTGLTSIALFVGGVGIMTVMLMSVNERTKEIGIRKTVGARSRDIFVQFLCEAMLLALIGCTAGLVLSYVACVILSEYTALKPLITAGTVLLSFAVATGVGGAFGLIPAMRAATRDPVLSLRYE